MYNELSHHGVKGMHWGIRRYQNYDGTRIGAGKKVKRKVGSAVDYASSSKTQKVVRESSNINNNLKSINKTVGRRTAKKTDLSSMSDQELQRAVNRMNLERNYLQLTHGNTSKGAAYVENVLDFAGDVLAVTGSAAAIAVSIKALRK